MPKKQSKPVALFKKGDRVRIGPSYGIPERVGIEANVRRVFWEGASGGLPAGFVCELDAIISRDQHGSDIVRYVTVWETLLERIA